MARRLIDFFIHLPSNIHLTSSSSALCVRNNQSHYIPRLIIRKLTMANEGPVEAAVHKKLTEALKPEHLDVINESPMHNVPKGSESHFKVVIVSQAFENITRIKKHQLVHQALQEELANDIHALSIVAKTPKEWQESQDVGQSPPCRGGSGL